MSKAKLHTDLIEQTLFTLSVTLDAKLRLYHLIGLWLDLPDADVYERFKARTALCLLTESLGEGAEEIHNKLNSAA